MEVSDDDEIEKILKEACEKEEFNVIKKYLFSEKIDVNKDFEGDGIVPKNGTLLHIACSYGRLEVVELLCSHPKINLNQKNNLGRTPLYNACAYIRPKIVNYLCEQPEIDINLGNKYGATPLHCACGCNFSEGVQTLLKQNKIDINKQDNYGRSALHCRSLNIVKIICENSKIDINLRDMYGKTAFYYACQDGHLETVKYLYFKYKMYLQENYENQICSIKANYSPLQVSCSNGKYEIVKFFCENNFDIEK
eukprot:c16409_g1_i3.p1 GENE.c16409_g1_i3~~c16409_g1_i3.p1  ORF type:complete len:273 (-),score=50.41 c16409_g1_i3:83-835(-)